MSDTVTDQLVVNTDNPRIGVEKWFNETPTGNDFDNAWKALQVMDRKNNFVGPQLKKKVEAGNPILEEVEDLIKEEVSNRLSKKYKVSADDLEASVMVGYEQEDNDISESISPGLAKEVYESEINFDERRLQYVTIEPLGGKKIDLPIVKIGEIHYAVDPNGFAYTVTSPDLGVDGENSVTYHSDFSNINNHLRIQTMPTYELKNKDKVIGQRPRDEHGNIFEFNGMTPKIVGMPSHLEMNFKEPKKDFEKAKVFSNNPKNPDLDIDVTLTNIGTAAIDGVGGMKGLARKLAPNVDVENK